MTVAELERLEARPPAPSQLAPVESVEDQQSVTPSPTIPPAQEIDSVHTEAQPAAAGADPAQSEVAAEPATTKARRKRAKAVPPQDEWGFFDGAQKFVTIWNQLDVNINRGFAPAKEHCCRPASEVDAGAVSRGSTERAHEPRQAFTSGQLAHSAARSKLTSRRISAL